MMETSEKIEYAGALVKDQRGWILCQLRDNKKGIVFPGIWTCTPGGHVRAGEKPEDAVCRELYEEFEVRVKDLRYIKKIEEKNNEAAGIYHMFTANSRTVQDDVKCHEGQKALFIRPEVALRLEQHPVSEKVLKEFL